MLPITKRRRWSIGTRIDFGVGTGEGLAAVRGYQSGAKGMLAVMPAFSREIEKVCGLSVRFPAATPLILCKILPRKASKESKGWEVKINGATTMLRAFAIMVGLAEVGLVTGCAYVDGDVFKNCDVMDALYYCECRRAEEQMIEMWIDFKTRRMRLKCTPHDALGWESRRFDSMRLDTILTQSEMQGVLRCVRLADVGTWRNISDVEGYKSDRSTTWYLRVRTDGSVVERFVDGNAPKGLKYIRDIVRFAYSHPNIHLDRGDQPFAGDWSWIGDDDGI